ncbi:hypothetical protein EGW08_011915, partial [Elysia chlorotica]
ILFLLVVVATSLGGYTPDKCYHYEDIAAKYKMRHDKSIYPAEEIGLVLERYPDVKKMFYADEHTYASLPTPRVSPLYSVCPNDKFLLYSFFYANKNCHVICPDVQQVYYVQCSSTHNRNCQHCGYTGSGVSKCVEDFQYRYVWAYCTHVTPDPHPHPHPQPKPRTAPIPIDPTNRNSRPFTPIEQYKPVTILAKPLLPHPQLSRYSYPTSYQYHDPWSRIYRTHVRRNRWRRSYHSKPKQYGTIERMALYLPFHCSCKTYTC